MKTYELVTQRLVKGRMKINSQWGTEDLHEMPLNDAFTICPHVKTLREILRSSLIDTRRSVSYRQRAGTAGLPYPNSTIAAEASLYT